MKRIPAFNEPFVFQWHITDACNLNCAHCYRTESHEDISFSGLRAVFSQFKSFLKRRSLAGRIHFAGGEPLLSAHLPDLAADCTAENLMIRILTNGTLLSKSKRAELYKAGVRYYQISVDGDTCAHDAIRGTKAMAVIQEQLSDYTPDGIEFTLAMTVSTVNLCSMENLIRRPPVPCHRLYFSRMVPFTKKQFTETLTQYEWFNVMKRILTIRHIPVPLRDPLFRPFLMSPVRAIHASAIGGCSAGFNSLAVESNGDVYPCRRLPIVIGNLLKDDIEDIWQHTVLKELRNRDALKGRCGMCAYRWLCGGCRGMAYAYHNDYLTEDPHCLYVCGFHNQNSMSRKKSFIFSVC